METVLQKTMQSLETALRYNPSSVELMASLAEVYIRLGRFDERTMDLCAAVLGHQVDNVLLQQAQSIGVLIEQSRALEEALKNGESPPPLEALESSLQTLDEFLAQSGDCVDAWIAWTRFQIMAGQLEHGGKGMETLRQMGIGGLEETLRYTLEWTMRRTDLKAEQYRRLGELYIQTGAMVRAIGLLEKLYDQGHALAGQALLDLYMQRYSCNRLEEVPEAIRERLFMLLLDYSDRELTGAWLRKASLLGWEVGCFSKNYARHLLEEDDLDDAFAVLQRMPMDEQIKQLLNSISERFEKHEEIEKAVAVLRFINDHELDGTNLEQRQEHDLAREAELSMADLQMRSGRYGDALQKYVSVLCLSAQADPLILDHIDEILESASNLDIAPILRLGAYFRKQEDHPKALFYLNQGLDRNPDCPEILHELESLFDEILQKNPDLPQLRLELGELYLRTGQVDQAIEKLTEAALSPALSAKANALLAKAYMMAGQFTEAIEKYRNLRITEEDFENLYELHEEFMRRQAQREALVALDLIAKVNPGYRDVGEKARLIEDRVGKLQPEVVTDPKMRELIGDLAVGRYQYIDRLGSGGMGVVHKVFDLRNQQVVAMKILRDSLSGSSKALDRFFREARIAATLRHRNIVNIYDYNISNLSGQSYIVMEYVDGPSLREIIDRQFQNTMSISLEYVAEILYYAVQLCDALDASHAKGIVHRDIKPDNIMITAQGEVKITDFGIVHVEEATFTPTGAMLGTPRYMAPEQVTGGKIDGRSDIYSVGILLYEVMAGSPPFMTGDVAYQQIHNDPVPPREINPLIPQGCAEMILKCLAKQPENRYLNAHSLKVEVIRQLENLGGCSKFEYQTRIESDESDLADELIGQDTDLDLV